MPDLDELFNSASLVGGSEYTPDYLVINNDFRTITIPSTKKLLGVTSDDSVNILNFRCPRYYGTVDLSPLTFRINYMNAMGEGDIYAVQDKTVDDSEITFSWTVGRHACRYSGSVRFIVCAYLSSNGTITQEYNTAVHTLPVVQGLETSEAVVEAEYDLIAEFLENIQNSEAYMNRAETAATSAEASKTAAANSATSASTSASSASASATSASNSATSASNSWSLVQQSAQIVESCVTATESANNAAETARESSSIALAGYLTSKAYGKEVVIENAADNVPVKDLKIKMEPHQDLHGYDHPWPAGGGKNLIPMTVDWIKSINTSGTWNGNSYTFNGITYTILTDKDNNVIGINTNGSVSGYSGLQLGIYDIPNGTYKLNGVPNVSATNVQVSIIVQTDYGSTSQQDVWCNVNDSVDVTFTVTTGRIRVVGPRFDNFSPNNLKFYPMIRLASNGDDTFEPYSNICPIEGYNEVEVTRRGRNLADPTSFTYNSMTYQNGVYSNTDTDTKTNLSMVVVAYTSSTVSLGPVVAQHTISSDGHYSYSFMPPEGTAKLQFKHSGSIKDLVIWIPCTLNEQQTLSFDVVGYNPSTVGGLIFKNIQLELGTTATSYEPYQGHTYNITFPSATTGTVYSGTMDVTTGELVVDRASAEVSISDIYVYNNNADFDYAVFTVPYAWKNLTSAFSSVFQGVSLNTSTEKEIGKWASYDTSTRRLMVSVPKNTTKSEAKGMYDGAQFCYELATPITYQLTATDVTTILGKNWIETNADNMDLEYRLAPAYVSKKIDETLASYVTETVSGSIASFDDGADDVPVKDLKVHIAPKQDLHGYDHPWPAGGGKNLAHDVNYFDPKNQYGNLIDATYSLKAGKRYIFSFNTPNTGKNAYRQSPANLGLDAASEYSWTCDGLRHSFYGTATADVTKENINIIARADATSDIGTGLLSNFMIEEVANDVVVPSSYEPYSNICPIEGWEEVGVTRTGKNLLSFSASSLTHNGVTFTINEDNTILCSGTANGTAVMNITDLVKHFPNGMDLILYGCPRNGGYASKYSLYATNNEGNTWYAIDEGNGFRINDLSFTKIQIIIRNGINANGLIFKPMVCLATANDPTAFEPYNYASGTLPITLPSEASTVYGGTLDVTTGELVATMAEVDLGTLTWSIGTTSGNGKRFSASNRPDAPAKGFPLGTLSTLVCSSFKTITGAASYSGANGIAVAQNSNEFFAYDSIYADYTAAQFKTAMSGVQLVYELATPITYYLTPTEVASLLGANNIWSDAGDVIVEYRADTKKYIAKQIAAAIAELN